MSMSRRIGWASAAVGATLLLLATPGVSSEVEQRLERLEAEIQALREQLRQSGTPTGPSSISPPAAGAVNSAATPTSRPPATPAPPSAPTVGMLPLGGAGSALGRYFLVSEPLTVVPPSVAPMAEGLLALEGDLRLDPARYGAADQGVFAYHRYRDASLYRAAGLALEGELQVPTAGPHRFVIAPKPAREGGGSPVTNEMTLILRVAGQPLIDLRELRGWRNQTITVDLPAGRHPFTLWVVSNSPGYGPSPIDSRLVLGVVMPGRAEVTPLTRLMLAPGAATGH
jgi:hypothetical protein